MAGRGNSAPSPSANLAGVRGSRWYSSITSHLRPDGRAGLAVPASALARRIPTMRALYSLVCRLRTLSALAQGTVTLVLDGWAALSPAQLLLLGCGLGIASASPDPVAGIRGQRAAGLNGSAAQHRRSRLCYRTGGHRCRRSMRMCRQTRSRSVIRAGPETVGYCSDHTDLMLGVAAGTLDEILRPARQPNPSGTITEVVTPHRLIDGGGRRRYYGRLVDDRANDDSQRRCEADGVVPARSRAKGVRL